MHNVISTATKVKTDGMLTWGREWAAIERCDFWERAEYIMPTAWHATENDSHAYRAMNIRITGHKVRYNVQGMLGCGVVRVQITLPGDGASDTVIGGWVLADTLS